MFPIMISTKDLFLVPLTFVNNLSWWPESLYMLWALTLFVNNMKTGPNYQIKLFSLFLEGLFIWYLFERDIYWYALSGIGVHYLQEVFKNVHQCLWIIYCPEWTILSYHPGVKWIHRSLDVMMYVLVIFALLTLWLLEGLPTVSKHFLAN